MARVKPLHPADQDARREIAQAKRFAIFLRRGPSFIISEKDFSSIGAAALRADELEQIHKPRWVMIYALGDDGRDHPVPREMQIAALNLAKLERNHDKQD